MQSKFGLIDKILKRFLCVHYCVPSTILFLNQIYKYVFIVKHVKHVNTVAFFGKIKIKFIKKKTLFLLKKSKKISLSVVK